MRAYGKIAAAVCVASLLLAGCGGGSDGPAPVPEPPSASATVGGSGQTAPVTIAGPGAATVTIPPDALDSAVTVRLSEDSSGAPAMPASLKPTGAVYALTPHGTRFNRPVSVRIPLPTAALAPNESYVLGKAEPGGEWIILWNAVEHDGALVADVDSFSFFRVFTQISAVVPGLGRWQPFWTLLCNGQPVQGMTCPEADGPVDVSLSMVAVPGAFDSECNPGAARIDYQIYLNNNLTAAAPIVSRPTASHTITLGRAVPAQRLGRLGSYASLFSETTLVCDAGTTGGRTYSAFVRSYSGPVIQWSSPNLNQAEAVPVRTSIATLAPGSTARIEALFKGGGTNSRSGRLVGRLDSVAYGPVSLLPPERGATIDWERSDDGGASWRVIARSFQHDSDQFPFGREVSEGLYWRVGHTFSIEGVAPDQVRLRARGCVTADVEQPGGGLLKETTCRTGQVVALPSVQAPLAPNLSQLPRSQLIVDGQTATLTATATGVPAATLQWQTRPANSAGAWTNVSAGSGGTTGSYTTRVLTLADNGVQYRVVASNAGGSAESPPVSISVSNQPIAPSITVQPVATTVVSGSDAVFAVAATGTEALSYSWYRNGGATPIAGANGPVLRLPAVTTASVGGYLAIVTNSVGQAVSLVARLTVTAGPEVSATAPTIVTQPTSVSVNTGNTATFAVGVNGTTPMVFQWVRNGVPIPGATAAAYTVASVAAGDGGTYEVIVGNSAGAANSAAATLTVSPSTTPVAPAISTQPVGLAVNPGQTATFAVAASGSGPLSYQWRRDGINLPGANGPVLTIGSAQPGDAGNYTLVVSNGTGSATSNAAGLVVIAAPGTPSISTQPANRSAVEGQTATFSLAVTGNPAPQCQWTRNSVAISGATSCTGYTTPTTSNADNGAVYNVVVYSPGGVAIGNGAVLSVQPLVAPTITTQPQNLTITEGQSAGFSAAATSNGALTFQWLRGGTSITGATDNVYSLGSTTIGDNGAQFSVRVCTGPQANNLCTLSDTVTLTVNVIVPANALTATQIVAGQEWSLVLRPDRTVWGWGSVHRTNGTVQYANQTLPPALRPVRLYPAVLSDVRAISGWFNSFWALKGEPGTTGSRVLHWGRAFAGNDGRGGDGNGSLGSSIPPRDNEAAPVEVLERVNNVPQPVDRVCAIAGGGEQLAMIRAINSAGTTTDCNAGSAKTVWFVGSLLARGYESTGVAFAMPGLPTNSPPAAIFTGKTTSGSPPLVIALEDGRLYGLGLNLYGGLGVSSTTNYYAGDQSGPLLLPATWGTPRSFGMSFYYSLFVVRADGSVVTSGYDGAGELGLGSVIGGSTLGPVAVRAETCVSLPCADTLTGVTALASGNGAATLALKNGQILGWGSRGSGLLGPVASGGQPFPRPVASPGVSGFTALSASNLHALVIGPGNVVYAWGSGLRGALGDGTENARTAPAMVTVP